MPSGRTISAAIISATFYLGKGSKTSDTEVINGEVLSKARTEGSYVESYSCHCHNVCSGSGKNRSCSEQCDASRGAQSPALIGRWQRRGFGADSEELPRTRYPFELVLPARLQGDPRARHEITHRSGNQHLSTVRLGADARRDVYGGAGPC